MDYWGEITVEVGQSILAPERELVKVCPGIVKGVWLWFPKGHVGTAKVRILYFEHQIWPTNLGAWYKGDGTVIEFEENYPLRVKPYEFMLESYTTSVAHPHTTYVRFTILPEERVVVPLPPRKVEVILW